MSRPVALLILLAACVSDLRAGTERLRVVATILPVYCIATNVGGELAEVRYLVGAGGDGHDYQLTPRDRSDIEKARLLLMNGLGLEPWLKRVIASADSPLKVVDLSRGLGPRLIPNEDGLHDEDEGDGAAGGGRGAARADARAHVHGGMNPHVWLDPILMCHMVTNALRGFQEVDPPNSERYARNAARYVERLVALDASMREGLRGLEGVAIVTYHEAFPYFARRYGLKVVGVIEEIPDVDPTPRHLARLVEKIRSTRARAIFVEPRHSRRLAGQLGRDLGVKVGTLDTLETGEASPGAYEDGMRGIVRTLQSTLR